MPRRALALITGVVLALHWLVLSGMSLGWESPAPASARVFTTRSIAPPPPPATAAAPAPPAAAAVTPPPPAPRKPPASPRPHPPSRQAAPPLPDDADAAPAPPSDAGFEPPAEEGMAMANDVAVAAADAASSPVSEHTAAPVAAAGAAPQTPPAPPAPPAPPTPPTSANPDTAAGVDISPPGGGDGRAPSTSPPPVRLPPPTRLAFDVTGQAKKFTYQARAQLLWQHDGARYEARQELSAFLVGSRAQSSVGQITPQGLQPERFSDRSRSEQAAHFDRAKGRIIFSANTPEAALGAGAQDRLSVFIQLGALLAADPPRFVPGTQVTLTTVSARSADRWTFTVEGTDTLDLPGGPTPALKLQRLPRKDYDQKAELWLAPSLGYLPVRIRITQANGDFADLLLRSSAPP